MAFRDGKRGHDLWEDCYRLSVAAISYGPLETTDLSQCSKCEPKELWAQLKPAQKSSLKRVAYEMKKGDIIYVKQGPKIVGKGLVKGSYMFDAEFRLIYPEGVPWAHQVPVEWAPDFPEINILLGAELLCVKELFSADIKKLETLTKEAKRVIRQREVLEGKESKKEAIFRSRNQALILAKKANSDYRCEVCGFSFGEKYGKIGRNYIIAHHLRLIASGISKNTLDDIALLCANCHSMVHTKNPPISINELRKVTRL
jgi:hypothetical protein